MQWMPLALKARWLLLAPLHVKAMWARQVSQAPYRGWSRVALRKRGEQVCCPWLAPCGPCALNRRHSMEQMPATGQ